MPIIKPSTAFKQSADWVSAEVRAYMKDQVSTHVDTVQDVRDNDFEKSRFIFVKSLAATFRLDLSSGADDDGVNVLHDNIGRRYLKVIGTGLGGVDFDAQVADLAGRAAYDDEAEGFKVLVSDVGDGRAAIYSKDSGASADWSDPAYVTGPQGSTGDIGGVAFQFDDGTTDANPGAGNIRANNADLSAATTLFVSKINRYGDNLSAFLATLDDSTSSHKGYLILTAPDSETQATFSITGLTDASGYVKLTVSGHSGATSFVDTERLVFQFSRTGNAGDLNGVTPGTTGLELLKAETTKAVREIIRVAVQPEGFGATYDGSDDAAAIEAAAAIAVAQDRPLLFSPGRTYSFSRITLPAGISVLARGATLRALGGLPEANDIDITLQSGAVADTLFLTRQGSSSNNYWIFLEEGVQVGSIYLRPEEHRNQNGILTYGQDVRIGLVDSENVERVLHCTYPASEEMSGVYRSGFHLGRFIAKDIRNGLTISRQQDFYVGNSEFERLSPSSPSGPGVNPILMSGVKRGRFGNVRSSVRSESAVRIGGSRLETSDIEIGDVYIEGSSGCAVKINTSGIVTGQRAKRVTIGHITGIDIGQGPTGDNQELLRVSHAEHVICEGITGIARDFASSGQWALSLNDCTDIEIGSINGDFNAGIRINETTDVDNVYTFPGPVRRVRIHEYGGSVNGFGSAITITMPTQTVGDIIITGISIKGFTDDLLYLRAATVNGVVFLQGTVTGPVAPTVDSNVVGSSVFIDIMHGGNNRYVGRADRLRFGTGFEISGERFNPGNSAPTGVVLPGTGLSGGAGAYGRAFEFMRIGGGSNYRGAAVALKQTGGSSFNNGISVLVSTANGASNEVMEVGLFDHLGRLTLPIAGQGVVLVSPDGATRRMLSIDNSGNAVWTSV